MKRSKLFFGVLGAGRAYKSRSVLEIINDYSVNLIHENKKGTKILFQLFDGDKIAAEIRIRRLNFVCTEIINLYVSEEYRRRGLAFALNKYLLEYGFIRTVYAMCTIREDNKPMLNCIKKLKFKKIEEFDYNRGKEELDKYEKQEFQDRHRITMWVKKI